MLKTLGAQIKEYKWASIATPVFMLLEVAVDTIIPLLMASIIDNGVNMGDTRHIYIMGVWMIVAALFGLLTGCLGAKYGAKAAMGFGKNLRAAMFRNIQTFSFANIDRFSSASLVTRMTTDVTNIQNAYMMLLRMAMRAPASIICAMAMSFFISPRLATIYLIAVIVLGALLLFISKAAMKYFDRAFKRYDDLNESVQENVSAIRVVKAYVREDYEKKRFSKAAQNIYDVFVKAESLVVYNSPLMQFTVYACILLISWLGAHMVVSSTLTTGDLMALLTYCMNILMNLMMLSMVFVMISLSLASARRISEVLNEQSTLHNPKEPLYDVPDGSISFKHVTFRYSDTAETPVLSDINLDIKSGETIGIIGGTGSSKSSLVNLISRLYDTDTGSVIVGGHDVREYDMDTLRNKVAVVLQQNVLFSGTILENLRWGDKNATTDECIEACKMACADDFIDSFPDKYNTYIEQGGTNVSGGQKQRLCIARALLKKPRILILDDSTSAVDTATDSKIRAALAKTIPGTTKLIIAQRISSVMDADRIIVMDDGKVDGFDTHENLLKNNEIYRDVYDSQTNGGGDFDEGGAA
ncbi:ABC transporter ATP-binding protein [Agathobacter rectalis]|jgi:ATP-binding cassette subfamily B multidrug efflux pump|uniref:ABC transporter ATP-binding protein n=1 Tax=Agathobacter rectalis TaxID=39491 RepID=A0AAX0BMB6_9FIRM|nr:ABC transporter ATP-binding protein [Agathobacter rectalis]HAR01157.1 ABC transporter [Eubacterium sp.]NSC76714.1 ABC transporter ATP-binding protein [Agathobacter rectalis]NSE99600.1 ABC transporter ATP-binding protein [Agathobacter rectalis]NSI71378.1 ABC transporter ATP-binding protein [Agathobacter rectalis]NSI76356.1 ABC transporter ATP-binding protein [Agathobacter rectalis]